MLTSTYLDLDTILATQFNIMVRIYDKIDWTYELFPIKRPAKRYF